jgi:hypothetical protein
MSREAAESLAAIAMPPSEGVKAIPVAPDSAFRMKRKTAYIQVEEEGALDPLTLARERLPGSVVCGVEVLEDKTRTKIERRRAKKRVTRWQILSNVSADPLDEYRTPTEACKAAEKLVRDGSVEVAHVHGEVDGEGSPSYATYRRVQTARRAKLKIMYVETTRKDPAPTGWVFFA